MNIPGVSSRALGSIELFAKTHGAAILTGIGVAGFTATTVLVGKAVLKSQPVIGGMKDDARAIASKELDDDYTKQDQVKETGQLYIRRSAVLLKIYTPAIGVGVTSIVCVIAAHGMMRRQQAALLAAYTTLDTGFRAYRARVVEELGKDKELEVYRGTRTSETQVKGKDIYTIHNYSDLIPSPYARFFDESSTSWNKTPEYNLMFLHAQQMWANDRLKAKGHLFLNEVYDAIGIPRSQAGRVVGWKWNPTADKDAPGDGFVDFGMYEIGHEMSRAFVNGIEPSILLDFNVDGVINLDE